MLGILVALSCYVTVVILGRSYPLFFCGYILFMSLVTMMVFGADKAAAIDRRRRVPERALFSLAASGGMPGALLGEMLFRHKSSKKEFNMVLLPLMLIQVVLFFVIILWK